MLVLSTSFGDAARAEHLDLLQVLMDGSGYHFCSSQAALLVSGSACGTDRIQD